MKWDKAKANAWFKVKNPHFGYISADALIVSGRGEKVREFIHNAKGGE